MESETNLRGRKSNPHAPLTQISRQINYPVVRPNLIAGQECAKGNSCNFSQSLVVGPKLLISKVLRQPN